MAVTIEGLCLQRITQQGKSRAQFYSSSCVYTISSLSKQFGLHAACTVTKVKCCNSAKLGVCYVTSASEKKLYLLNFNISRTDATVFLSSGFKIEISQNYRNLVPTSERTTQSFCKHY